jgi:hypothetical protein
MGLEPRATLLTLFEHPYQLIRLAALWNEMEPAPNVFDPAPLDWQVEAAERAGKQVIVAVGAVKNFGYPELFVPRHHLPTPLPEGKLVSEESHPELLDAAVEFVARVVDRYRGHESVIAWQVEHEAVDPLGVEHSWRLAAAFVSREVAEVRRLDPKRPVLLNGFLPMSLPVARSSRGELETRATPCRSQRKWLTSSAWTSTRATRLERRVGGRLTWTLASLRGRGKLGACSSWAGG